jgi:hypothetical protein
VIEQDRRNRSNLRQTQEPQTATLGGEPGSWIRNATGRAPSLMKLGHTQGRFEMGAFSDSYVLRVLLATPTRARSVETVARRWRWLRTTVVDPYRPELYHVRGSRPEMAGEACALRWLLQPPPPPSLQRTAQFRARIHRGAWRRSKMANIAFALDCAAGGSWCAPRVEIVAASNFQKRKRNPAVVARLLRSRKPFANPPLSLVDMMPR